jgi:hypothetical protein
MLLNSPQNSASVGICLRILEEILVKQIFEVKDVKKSERLFSILQSYHFVQNKRLVV